MRLGSGGCPLPVSNKESINFWLWYGSGFVIQSGQHRFLDRAQELRVTKHESYQLLLVYHAQAFTATLDSIAVAYVSAAGCWHYV